MEAENTLELHSGGPRNLNWVFDYIYAVTNFFFMIGSNWILFCMNNSTFPYLSQGTVNVEIIQFHNSQAAEKSTLLF